MGNIILLINKRLWVIFICLLLQSLPLRAVEDLTDKTQFKRHLNQYFAKDPFIEPLFWANTALVASAVAISVLHRISPPATEPGSPYMLCSYPNGDLLETIHRGAGLTVTALLVPEVLCLVWNLPKLLPSKHPFSFEQNVIAMGLVGGFGVAAFSAAYCPNTWLFMLSQYAMISTLFEVFHILSLRGIPPRNA